MSKRGSRRNFRAGDVFHVADMSGILQRAYLAVLAATVNLLVRVALDP